MKARIPEMAAALLAAAMTAQADSAAAAAPAEETPKPILVSPVYGAGIALPGFTFGPSVALPGWSFRGAAGGLEPDADGWRAFRMRTGGQDGAPVLEGRARFAAAPEGAVRGEWRLVPSADANVLETCLSADVPSTAVGGGRAVLDGREIAVPLDGAKPHLFRGPVTNLSLVGKGGEEVLRIAFDRPTRVLLQDGAHWGAAHLTMRLFFAEGPLEGGREYAVAATFATPAAGPLEPDAGGVRTIRAGEDWVPLRYDPWIEPGSALDFTAVLPHHAPAGKFGRVVAVGDHFEFEGLPGVPQRFYGVNLCFTANLPSSREAADRFVANLARIGYNAIRVHHHERSLVVEDGRYHPGQDDTAPSPAQWEKFDNLVAACVENGVYLTTDLFVSRSHVTPWRAVGIDRDGTVPQDAFKVLAAFHEPAYSNLCAWTRAFLGHVNPRTGRSLAEEPALATLALINEGNLGNWGGGFLRDLPGVADAWQAWISAKAGEPAFADIPSTIPDTLYAEGGDTVKARHSAAFAIFLAERETALFERLKAFVRDECGCKAPLSSLSCWYNPAQYQLPRTHFDYVDDHFYVDHPVFLERPWSLPSSCANVNPVAGPGAGARDVEWRRLMDKPFCLTEWNYSAPGRFRGVGGIATGALGALQDWDGMWRFAWSHGRGGIENPGGPIGYFDVNADPLALAAERAALCLFLRRDLKPHAEARPAVLDEVALLDPRNGAPRFPGPAQPLALGWSARVGTVVPTRANDGGDFVANDVALRANDGGGSAANDGGAPRQMTNDEFQTNVVSAAIGGSVTVDRDNGVFAIDTPRTAGGFTETGTLSAGPLTFTLLPNDPSLHGTAAPAIAGEAGPVIAAEGGASLPAEPGSSLPRAARPVIDGGGGVAAATVWVSSLDNAPITSSEHLLVTHLTDVQNNGVRYGDPGRRILLGWGGLPHLAQRGAAEVSLEVEPGDWRVWRLDTAGRRVDRVPSAYDRAAGRLSFTARTDYDPDNATLLYELEWAR